MRVRGKMGDPDSIMLGPKVERGLLLDVVPGHFRKVAPVLVVVAENRDRVGGHRACARLVVVLADQVGQGQCDVAVLHFLHAEVVPVGLAVAAALVVLARDQAAKSILAERLDLPQRASLEVGVEEDRRIRPGR